MAFTTQRRFYLVNDPCGRRKDFSSEEKWPPELKSYSSCTDSRAWSPSREEQSNFLVDFMSGDHFRRQRSGDRISRDRISRDRSNGKETNEKRKKHDQKNISKTSSTLPDKVKIEASFQGRGMDDGASPNNDNRSGVDLSASMSALRGASISVESGVADETIQLGQPGYDSDKIQVLSADATSFVKNGQIANSILGDQNVQGAVAQLDKSGSILLQSNESPSFTKKSIPPKEPIPSRESDDSLIASACLKLSEIHAIVYENERENKAENLFSSESRSDQRDQLKQQLLCLYAKGDFTPNSVMLALQKHLENTKINNQHIDVIQAENESLRKQLTILEARLCKPCIPTEPERSRNITYLQSLVDNLRNEEVQLRAMEEQYARIRIEFDKLKTACVASPGEAAELVNIPVGVDETKCNRDRLRQLLANMTGIGDQLRQLKERVANANQLERQSAELRGPQGEMGGSCEIEQLQREREESENQLSEFESMKHGLDMYEIHYDELLNEMQRMCVKLFKLERELNDSRQQLAAAESTICSYERDIDELMCHFHGLSRHLVTTVKHCNKSRKFTCLLLVS